MIRTIYYHSNRYATKLLNTKHFHYIMQEFIDKKLGHSQRECPRPENQSTSKSIYLYMKRFMLNFGVFSNGSLRNSQIVSLL